VTLSETEARRKKEEWYKKWPEMRLYHQHFGSMTLGDRKFTLVQPGSNRVRGEVGFCDGANCVDYETEALTQRGWVRGDDLRLDDFVLTKNAETGELEWQQPDAVFHYPDYDGPLVEFVGEGFSAVTTPEHRWLVTDEDGTVRCVVSADLRPTQTLHLPGNGLPHLQALSSATTRTLGDISRREFTEARGVWCPSVPNTYFVARRNKTVYITGNSVFQGRAADGAKRAGWYIAKECYLADPYRDGSGPTPLHGSRPVLFVHDEFILEVPVATAHAATARLSEVMIAGMREVVPDVKVGTEYAIAARWYKGAEAAYDENKRLIPWEPKKK